MIQNLISISILMQLMFVIIIALGVIIISGAAYPRIKFKTGKRELDVNDVSFGSNKMYEELNNYNSSGNFNDGIIFVYKLLRNNLSKMESFPNKNHLTEFEIINQTVSKTPELKNISTLIIEAYKKYELARFRAITNSSDLNDMNNITRNMTKHNHYIINTVEWNMDLFLLSIIIVTSSTLIYSYYYRKNILTDNVVINYSQTFQGLLGIDQQPPNYFEATKILRNEIEEYRVRNDQLLKNDLRFLQIINRELEKGEINYKSFMKMKELHALHVGKR